MPFRVVLRPRAARDLETLNRQHSQDLDSALDRIEELAANPRPQGVKKLKGRSGEYRVRVGRLRIVYSIDDDGEVVRVLAVLPRDKAYD